MEKPKFFLWVCANMMFVAEIFHGMLWKFQDFGEFKGRGGGVGLVYFFMENVCALSASLKKKRKKKKGKVSGLWNSDLRAHFGKPFFWW